MSTQTVTKKRKSVDGSASATKKVKVAKSADKPAPEKSALKRSAGKAKEVKTKKSKTQPAESKPAEKKIKSISKPAKKEKTVISDDDAPLTADQTASLLAGFSSEDDASDNEDEPSIPNSKIPQAPTTADIQSRIASATKTKPSDPENTSGVIYLGRLPHGFHEPQLRAYLTQFGEIMHLKLARNRKTGKSKHFAFIEFASAAVADIVCKTMDKYLLFGHILQVRRVPAEQVGDGMWVGEGRRGWNVRPNRKLEGGVLRRGRTREGWEGVVKREEKRREGKKGELAEMGYDFEMPAVKGVEEVPAGTGKGGQDGVGNAEEIKLVEQAEGGAEDEVVEPTVVVEKEKTKTKKRSAEGKPKVKEAKKAVKKVKT